MQLMLPMLTVYSGPRLVEMSVIDAIKTYREAVQVCWGLRTNKALTKRSLAEACGCYASHVTDYLKPGPSDRNLPPGCVADFEIECNNRVITQWMTRRAELTILEQFIQPAKAVA